MDEIKQEIKKLEAKKLWLETVIRSDELRQVEQHRFADEAQAKNESILRSLDEAKVSLSLLQNKIKEFTQEENVLKKKIFNLKNELVDLEQSQVDDHKKRENARLALREIEDTYENMLNTKKDLAGIIEQQKIDLEKCVSQIEFVKFELSQIFEKISSARAQLVIEEKKLEEFKKIANAAIIELEREKDAIIEQKAEVERDIFLKKEGSEKRFTELDISAKMVQNELESTKVRYDRIIESQTKAILQNKQEIVQLSSERDSLKKTIQSLEVKKIEHEMYASTKQNNR